MELTTITPKVDYHQGLFMITKIQNLNGTHNVYVNTRVDLYVVYDVKDTKFEWNL